MRKILFVFISLALLSPKLWAVESTHCAQALTSSIGGTADSWEKFFADFGNLNERQSSRLESLIANPPQISTWQKQLNSLLFWRMWQIKNTLRQHILNELSYAEETHSFSDLSIEEKRVLIFRLTNQFWFKYPSKNTSYLLKYRPWLSPKFWFKKILDLFKESKPSILQSRFEDLLVSAYKPGVFSSLLNNHARELYLLKQFSKIKNIEPIRQLIENRLHFLQYMIFQTRSQPQKQKLYQREAARAQVLLESLESQQTIISTQRAQEIYNFYGFSQKEAWLYNRLPNLKRNTSKIAVVLMATGMGLTVNHLLFDDPEIIEITDPEEFVSTVIEATGQ